MSIVTCERDGGALVHVERVQGYGVERLRVLFVCGHSLFVERPRREPGESDEPQP